jgi:recombination protein RecR
MEYTRSTDRLIAEINRLPGIGRKMAQRIALHLLKVPREDALRLARLIIEVKKKTRDCSTCFNVTEEDPCPVCADMERDRGLLCVVEEPQDLAALEKARAFRGVYHVLGGAISPLEGVGPDELKVKELLARIEAGSFLEVVVATNPTIEGEATALFLGRLLEECKVKITRLARGVPVGGELEYLDEVTICKAMDNRRQL